MAGPDQGPAIFVFRLEEDEIPAHGRRYSRKSLVTSATDVIEFIFADFAAQGVAVHSEDFRSAGLISVQFFEYTTDEFFFELGDRFLEQNSTLDH
jgi:hypothetical protein